MHENLRLLFSMPYASLAIFFPELINHSIDTCQYVQSDSKGINSEPYEESDYDDRNISANQNIPNSTSSFVAFTGTIEETVVDDQ